MSNMRKQRNMRQKAAQTMYN